VKRLVQKQVQPADDQRAYQAAIHVALRRISGAASRERAGAQRGRDERGATVEFEDERGD